MRKFSQSQKRGPSSRVSRIRGGSTPETTYMRPQARRQIVPTWCFSWALRRVKARVQRKRRGVASKVGAGCPSGFQEKSVLLSKSENESLVTWYNYSLRRHPLKAPIRTLKLGDRSISSGVTRAPSSGLRHTCSVSAITLPIKFKGRTTALSRKSGIFWRAAAWWPALWRHSECGNVVMHNSKETPHPLGTYVYNMCFICV